MESAHPFSVSFAPCFQAVLCRSQLFFLDVFGRALPNLCRSFYNETKAEMFFSVFAVALLAEGVDRNIPEARLDERQLTIKLVLAVIAVAGGFLTERCHPMPDDLMRYTAITDKLDRERAMLQHRLMPPADDAPDKCLCASIGDLVLRLVADTSALLQPLQNYSPIDRRDKLHICVNDLHGLHPPALRCPVPSPS